MSKTAAAGREGARRSRRAAITALVTLVALSSALMITCARGDLWLDEILSMQWARNARSPLDLITTYRHDNNHILNTAWLYLLGEGRPPLTYRALSIVSGTISLILLFRVAELITPAARFHILALACFSYAMVLYGSEARGYAPAIACSLALLLILLETKRVPHPLWTPLFWIIAILGLLFHATSIYPLAAMGTWVLVCSATNPPSWRRGAAICGAWFLIPFSASVAYYLYFLKPMMIAGGPKYSLEGIASEFFGYGIGLPVGALWNGMTIGASVLLTGASLAVGRFRGDQTRLLLALAVLVFPAAGLFASNAQFLHFRYFIVSLPFVLLLIGGLVETCVERWRFGRIASGVAVVTLIGFQLPRIASLAVDGRGRYVEALTHITQSQHNESIIISDHDMLIGMVIEYYRARHPEFSRIRYAPSWVERPKDAEWLITHRQGDSPAAPEASLRIGTTTYHFDKAFRSAPVSGAHWIVYRNRQP